MWLNICSQFASFNQHFFFIRMNQRLVLKGNKRFYNCRTLKNNLSGATDHKTYIYIYFVNILKIYTNKVSTNYYSNDPYISKSCGVFLPPLVLHKVTFKLNRTKEQKTFLMVIEAYLESSDTNESIVRINTQNILKDSPKETQL